MGQLEGDQGNANVTLDPWKGILDVLSSKEFPCPLCKTGLPILRSKRNKPYCTCNDCGLQIFVRGKKGIACLQHMAEHGILIPADEGSAAHAVSLFNRLERLNLQKRDLEMKRGIVGFLFPDENVENALSLVDAEIESVQGELARLSRAKQKEKKT